MRGFLKWWLLLVPCFAVSFILSYTAFYNRSLSHHVFHTVRAVRACDSVAGVVLFPAHFLLSSFGGVFDQSTPDSSPMSFIMMNTVFLSILFYACMRPLVFRTRKSGQ
jgi:hypothetical protein